MASAKKKQDEKNLKILRELVSLPVNKECFDCRQKGPTYVNMTIGSFVCTSCSGILRGLTPPHRVKSISMATFTPEEIEFVKERGNEHCRRIWLGLADCSTIKIQDTKDEQKMKDLMISKYELKRYYLDPSVANRSKIQKSSSTFTTTANNSQTSQSQSIAAVQRVPHFLNTTSTPSSNSMSTNLKTKNSDPVNNDNFNADFVADFSQIPDPFSSVTTNQDRFNETFNVQQSFANFDNNPVFNSAKSDKFSLYNDPTTIQSFANFNGINKPPSEDRYAALKDLDSLMKQTQLKEETQQSVIPQTSSSSTWESSNNSTISGNNGAHHQIWGNISNNKTGNAVSNPFASSGGGCNNDPWQQQSGTNHFINNNNNNNNNKKNNKNSNNNNMQQQQQQQQQQSDNNTCNSANPFRTMQFQTTLNNEHQWFGVSGLPGNGEVLNSSQTTTTTTTAATLVTPVTQFTSKIYQPTSVNSYQNVNPFMVGSAVVTTTRNTNNPFL